MRTSGGGVIATVDDVQVACGNDKLMARLGVEAIPCHSIGTIVHVAVDGNYAGHIVVADVVKPHAREAIAALRQAGIRKTIMLTGDRRNVAEKVAAELGVDEVHSELLPADKVSQVEAILAAKPEKERLAFVGDGINDAPVLRRADIGIAMGAMGSDAAIEAADIVLMDDDPQKIVKAIRISRKTLRIVYQNIVFAIGIFPSVEGLTNATNNGVLYVRDDDGDITGMIVFDKIQPPEFANINWHTPAPDDAVAVIHMVNTRPRAYRKGIAKSLVDFAADWARENGCTVLRSECGSQNLPAVLMFKRFGFERVGVSSIKVSGVVQADGHIFYEKVL